MLVLLDSTIEGQEGSAAMEDIFEADDEVQTALTTYYRCIADPNATAEQKEANIAELRDAHFDLLAFGETLMEVAGGVASIFHCATKLEESRVVLAKARVGGACRQPNRERFTPYMAPKRDRFAPFGGSRGTRRSVGR